VRHLPGVPPGCALATIPAPSTSGSSPSVTVSSILDEAFHRVIRYNRCTETIVFQSGLGRTQSTTSRSSPPS
jgi:hypothetical protein